MEYFLMDGVSSCCDKTFLEVANGADCTALQWVLCAQYNDPYSAIPDLLPHTLPPPPADQILFYLQDTPSFDNMPSLINI